MTAMACRTWYPARARNEQSELTATPAVLFNHHHTPSHATMSLLDLPNELFLSIATCLESQRDINALTQTGRRFYAVVNPYLYRYNARRFNGSAVLWAAGHGTVHKALKAGVEVQPPAVPAPPGMTIDGRLVGLRTMRPGEGVGQSMSIRSAAVPCRTLP